MSLADEMTALLAAHGSQAVLQMLASACEGLALLAPSAAAEREAFKAGAMLAGAAKLVERAENRCSDSLYSGIEMQEECARSLAEEDAREAATHASAVEAINASEVQS